MFFFLFQVKKNKNKQKKKVTTMMVGKRFLEQKLMKLQLQKQY